MSEQSPAPTTAKIRFTVQPHLYGKQKIQFPVQGAGDSPVRGNVAKRQKGLGFGESARAKPSHNPVGTALAAVRVQRARMALQYVKNLLELVGAGLRSDFRS